MKSIVLALTMMTFSSVVIANEVIPGRIYQGKFHHHLWRQSGLFDGHYVAAITEVSLVFHQSEHPSDYLWWAQVSMQTTVGRQQSEPERLWLAGNELNRLHGPVPPGAKPTPPSIWDTARNALGFPYPYSDELQILSINEDDSIDAHYYFTTAYMAERAGENRRFDVQLHLN